MGGALVIQTMEGRAISHCEMEHKISDLDDK